MHGDLRQAGRERGVEQVGQRLDAGDGAVQALRHLVEVVGGGLRHRGLPRPDQPGQRVLQGVHRHQQLTHLALQFVQAADGLEAALAEHVALGFHGVVLEAVERRPVVVDDLADDGGEHSPRPTVETLARALHLCTELRERAGLAVAHAAHGIGPHQHGHLAEHDVLVGVVVAGGAQHQVGGRPVQAEHRTGMGLQELGGGHVVQVQQTAGLIQLGLRRHPQAEPDEALAAVAPALQVVEPLEGGAAATVLVGDAVDDHACSLPRRTPNP